MTASARRKRINCRRLAPIAWRMDSSRSRIALRTCTMPEIFRHTTSSTMPVSVSAIACKIVSWGRRKLPLAKYSSAMPILFSFVAGYCSASRDVTADTAALACAT